MIKKIKRTAILTLLTAFMLTAPAAETALAESVSRDQAEEEWPVLGACKVVNNADIFLEPDTGSPSGEKLPWYGIIRVEGQISGNNGESWYIVKYSKGYDGMQAAPMEEVESLTGYIQTIALETGIEAVEYAAKGETLYAYTDSEAPIYDSAAAEKPMSVLHSWEMLPVLGVENGRLRLTVYDGTEAFMELSDVKLKNDSAWKAQVEARKQEKEAKKAAQEQETGKKETTADPADPKEEQPDQAETTEAEKTVHEKSWEEKVSDSIVSIAMNSLGCPYVFGGESLTSGVDCSGFIEKVYSTAGIWVPRQVSDQYAQSVKISREQLRPGDLVFYVGYYNGVPTEGVGHVAIYVGDGMIVHSRNAARGVCSDPIDTLPIIGYGRFY